MAKVNGEEAFSTVTLSEKLGFNVPSSYFKFIGCEPDLETSTGYFWKKERFPEICLAIIDNLTEKAREDLLDQQQKLSKEIEEMKNEQRS